MSFQFDRIIATFGGREAAAYQWVGNTDERFARPSRRVKVEPSAEDWEAYRAAMVGLEALNAYDFAHWAWCDCNDDRDSLVTVDEPKTRYRLEWLETVDEWLARCRDLRKEMESADHD